MRNNLRFVSALNLSIMLEQSSRDDRVRMVVRRGAEMACERRPEWWRWSVWMAAAITLDRCGIVSESSGSAAEVSAPRQARERSK